MPKQRPKKHAELRAFVQESTRCGESSSKRFEANWGHLRTRRFRIENRGKSAYTGNQQPINWVGILMSFPWVPKKRLRIPRATVLNPSRAGWSNPLLVWALRLRWQIKPSS